MYYEIVSKHNKHEMKREKVLENREEIIRIVQKLVVQHFGYLHQKVLSILQAGLCFGLSLYNKH